MSGAEDNVRQVHRIDGDGRTPEQKEEIELLGGAIARLLARASDGDVLMDVLVGMVISAALNTGGDEAFIGGLVAETVLVFPQFKAHRDAGARGAVQ